MRKLREHGVYELPDGRKVVAVSNDMDGYYLYSYPPHARVFPAFEVMTSGAIYSAGRSTNWRSEDLRDTGSNEG